MRPTVTWFGESLPSAAQNRRSRRRSSAISCWWLEPAVVYPAAAPIELASRGGAVIIVVNSEITAATPLAEHELLGSAEDILPKLLRSR